MLLLKKVLWLHVGIVLIRWNLNDAHEKLQGEEICKEDANSQCKS